MKDKASKGKKIDGLYIIKNKEKLLQKKKRNKKLKKLLVLFSLLMATIITMALNLKIFNVKDIEVKGNNLLNAKDVISASKINIGENIFKLNCSNIQSYVKENQYVIDVVVKRKLPNKIVISVEERKAKYYEYVNREFYIIDENGIILENRQSIDEMNLIRVEGILTKEEPNDEVEKPGDKKEDKDKNGNREEKDIEKKNEDSIAIRKGRILKEVSRLTELNTSDIKVKQVNVSDVSDIVIYLNNMEIYLGTMEKLKEKLNIAINIMKEKKLEEISGYIDISYHGNPVLYISH